MCAAALERVMRMVPGVAEVVTDPRRLPPHDLVCPMFSLPRVFGTTVDTIPPVPLLVPEAALQRHWAGRLPEGGLRVGLVWAGQARPSLPGFGTLDRRRSAGLAAFAPMFDVAGVSRSSACKRGQRRGSSDPPAWQSSIRCRRSEISPTPRRSSPVWTWWSASTPPSCIWRGWSANRSSCLDRYDGCWRWLSGRSDSPWYPHLTIFRQPRPGDWSEPMAKVAASLAAMAVSPRPRSAVRQYADACVRRLTSESIAWRQSLLTISGEWTST